MVMIGASRCSPTRPTGRSRPCVRPNCRIRVHRWRGRSGRRIDAKQDLPPDTVRNAAGIIRAFIEDYHEKLEEDYLFPRFEKARRLADLTQVLRAQHQGGRRVTEQITCLATLQTLKDPRTAA